MDWRGQAAGRGQEEGNPFFDRDAQGPIGMRDGWVVWSSSEDVLTSVK
ncbi:hypothetical protein F0726_00117 [Acidithiobacillus caldus]|nr:hypothetical protein F0726_00117 [Acidithiobacillus caldus]